MNPTRHFFVERNVDCAEEPDREQTNPAETLPQSQADVSELHRHDFPRQRHSQRRAPDHWTAADGIIEGARVIDQPRVSRKLREADYNSEKKKSREQRVTSNDCKADEQTIIDKIKSGPRAPVRPRCKRQQRNRNDIDDNRRDHYDQAFPFERRFGTRLRIHPVDVNSPNPASSMLLVTQTILSAEDSYQDLCVVAASLSGSREQCEDRLAHHC